MPDTPTDLTTSEVADRLGVTVRQVHYLRRTGALEPIRKLPGIRGPLLFRARDVERLARKRGAA